MSNREEAKLALDKLIQKSRVHLYKPMQIAEILRHDRVCRDVNLLDLETYRTRSKQWRDAVSLELLGRVCTSSARFQDDLFNDNAIPPRILNVLGAENRRTGGAVEAYIYSRFYGKHTQLSNALRYCLDSNKDSFDVLNFINSFWNEPGLKRSLDKIYEIIVYALFSTLVDSLELKVEISINEDKLDLLREFSEFAEKIMALDIDAPVSKSEARIYRVGVTNAADRGLDMYSNWGPAIQIKHLCLDEELAEEIVTSIASDRIVIVCKEAERNIILSLLTQIGWKSRIQSIVTESDLVSWYEKALRGDYAEITGDKVIGTLCEEIAREFPAIDETIPAILSQRKYEDIKDDFWCHQNN